MILEDLKLVINLPKYMKLIMTQSRLIKFKSN